MLGTADVFRRKISLETDITRSSSCSYVEWSTHEPEEGEFDFKGQADVVRFITMAGRLGFLVLLRPGPYIDAERDMVLTTFAAWKRNMLRLLYYLTITMMVSNHF